MCAGSMTRARHACDHCIIMASSSIMHWRIGHQHAAAYLSMALACTRTAVGRMDRSSRGIQTWSAASRSIPPMIWIL